MPHCHRGTETSDPGGDARAMMTDAPAENTARKQRGRPFEPGRSGNPAGKPKGTRNRASTLLDAIAEADLQAIVSKFVERAKAGDLGAAKLIFDRIAPPPRTRAVEIALPEVGRYDAADTLLATYGAITKAIATGEITPSEAVEIIAVIDAHKTAITDLRPDAMRQEPTPEERAERERLDKQMADLLKAFSR
jgi:hypothetical protein